MVDVGSAKRMTALVRDFVEKGVERKMLLRVGGRGRKKVLVTLEKCS